jgi:hypothetical protein
VAVDLLTEVARDATVGPDRVPIVRHVPEGFRVASRLTLSQLGMTGIEGAFRVDPTDPEHLFVDGYAMVFAGAEQDEVLCPEWGPGRQQLAVSSVGGSAHHLAAIATLRTDGIIWFGCQNQVLEVQQLEVAGRPAWYSRGAQDAVLAFVAPAGNVGIIRAVGPDPLAVDELLRMAEGYESIDQAAWEQDLLDRRGGPGLRPDAGRAEITRGTFAQHEWLLQTAGDKAGEWGFAGGRPGPDEIGGANLPVPLASLLDDCILLGSGRRVCATPGAHRGAIYDRQGADVEASGALRFEVGLVKPSVVRVRVTLASGAVVEAETVPLPGSDVRVYVVSTVAADAGVAIGYLDAGGSLVPAEQAR